MHLLARWSIALAATCVAVSSGAQQAPVRDFVKPDAEFPEAFTNLTSMRELPGGRVLVLEGCEHVVKLADFRSGALTTFARTGDGPREYRLPARIFALPGDSAAIFDVANRRMLIVTPDGKPGGFIRMSDNTSVRGSDGSVMTTSFSPTLIDGQGRFYMRGSGLLMTPDGLRVGDSAEVVRWTPGQAGRDTVAFVHLRKRTAEEKDVRRRPPEPPFTTGIQWAVDGDGRAALVAPDDYHVEFMNADGSRTVGTPIPFTPVPVGAGEKKMWHDEQQPACAMPSSGTMTTPSGQTIRFYRPATPEPTTWPAHLPPFRIDAAQFAPDGILWVQRTTPAGGAPLFDLIDRSGRVIQQVRLAKRSKLLGFGNGTMYVLRIDDDDLQYLQRYKLPAIGRT